MRRLAIAASVLCLAGCGQDDQESEFFSDIAADLPPASRPSPRAEVDEPGGSAYFYELQRVVLARRMPLPPEVKDEVVVWARVSPSFVRPALAMVTFRQESAGAKDRPTWVARRALISFGDFDRAMAHAVEVRDQAANAGAGDDDWPEPAALADRLPVYRQITDEAHCPGLRPSLADLERSLRSGVDVGGAGRWDRHPKNSLFDGADITVGARGVLLPSRTLGDMQLTSNVDGPPAQWLFRAMHRMRTCWRADRGGTAS